MRAMALVALVFGGVVLSAVGCKKEEAPAPPPAASADPNSTGVAECDTYIKNMRDCYANTPQAQQIIDSTNALREKLKGDIQAQGADAIKATCVKQIEGLKLNPLCAKK